MKPLLFMHIHKTGGQSLSRFLEQFFAPDEVCPHNTDHAILACSPRMLARYRFFRGHISMHGLSQRVPDFSTVTVLRNPKDRLVSAFHYWQGMAKSNEPNLPSIMRRFPSMTFADFLSSPDTRHCCDNVQARLLAGGHFGTTNDERIMVYGVPFPLRKERFAYIGKTDDLDAAATALCDLFSFTPPQAPSVGRVNARKIPPPTLSPRDEELIAARTVHDWDAYTAL